MTPEQKKRLAFSGQVGSTTTSGTGADMETTTTSTTAKTRKK